MALIICPECGKQFSDKAAACPNCGCPTSEAVKGRSAENAQKEASKKMLACVERTLDQARKAGAQFEREADAIRRAAAEREIDLFSRSAADDVKRIVHMAVKSCSGLFDAYQGLVRALDGECRPLLANNPDTLAIRCVLGTIRWLNEESEIENNYAIQFKGFDLGNAVKAKYLPDQASLVLQGLWQAEYDRLPKQAQTEAAWEEKLALHKKLAAQEEKAAKAGGAASPAAANRPAANRASRAETEAKKANLEKDVKKWIEKSEKTRERRGREVEKRVSAADAERLKSFDLEIAEIAGKAKLLEQEKAAAEAELSKLGVFQLSEKKPLKEKIKALELDAQKLMAQKKTVEDARAEAAKGSVAFKKKAAEKEAQKVKEDIPMPVIVLPGEIKCDLDSLKEALYKLVASSKKPVSKSAACAKFSQYPEGMISFALTDLIYDGLIVRIEQGRMGYFQLAP